MVKPKQEECNHCVLTLCVWVSLYLISFRMMALTGCLLLTQPNTIPPTGEHLLLAQILVSLERGKHACHNCHLEKVVREVCSSYPTLLPSKESGVFDLSHQPPTGRRA